jgi:hypothetical protein
MEKLITGYKSQTLPQEVCVGVRLDHDFIIAHWSEMSKQLGFVKHIWETHYTLDSMKEAILANVWQAWGFGPQGVIRVTVFTQIIHYPAGIVLTIPIAFGNSLDALLPVMEATFERFAQANECSYCEIFGRPGWERKLDGFKRAAVVLRRKVVRTGVH